jgi:hypothetical protein
MEISMEKLNVVLPYDPATPLPGIYLKGCKSACNKDTCTFTFIATLFTIVKLWNRPRCPSTDQWIKKMRYIYTIEYYSAIKRNEMMSFVGKWMELEIIMLSEISQTQEDKYCIFSNMSNTDLKQK